jgi:hypothetical protein
VKLSLALAISLLCAAVAGALAAKMAIASDDWQSLVQTDRAAFGSELFSSTLDDKLLDPNFSWTDSSGNNRNKSELLQVLKPGKRLSTEIGGTRGSETAPKHGTITTRIYGQVGLVQENSGNLYILRVWIKRGAGWQLLIDHAVSIGAPPPSEPGTGACENPCNTVPFQPRSEDESEVIRAYQAVERAVTAHDSAAWAAHIGDDFFAVTSNSDRPLNKTARMAGLDHQKVGGIAPFPLVSARMFQFGDAMVMISLQQPAHGLPLHVTRVWFKRNGAWLEAYSYQTTIQAGVSAQKAVNEY